MNPESFRGNDPNMAELVPCYFPRFGTATGRPKQSMSIRVNSRHLQDLLRLHAGGRESIPCVLRAVWALVLRSYTDSEDICFGYKEINVNVLVNGVPKKQGAFGDMSAARLTVDGIASLQTIVERAKSQCILNRVPEGSGAIVPQNARRLPFNTAVIFRTCTNLTTTVETTCKFPFSLTLPEEV